MKIDQGFLMAVLGLFSAGETSDEQLISEFHKDCEAVDQTLMEDTNKSVTAVARHFYDELHCSPIKVSHYFHRFRCSFFVASQIKFDLRFTNLRST